MMLTALMLVPSLLSACVVEDPFGADGYDDHALWVEPQSVSAGSTAVVTVTDDYGNVDFRQVWDVRPLGDFDVVEWTPRARSVDAVLELAPAAYGEQVLALELSEGTVYATFDAQ